ncbi:hypothetical protein OQA88_1110 [Cercophora sp. LCS_1]
MPVIRTEDEWRADLSRVIRDIQLWRGYAPLRTRQDKHNPHLKERQIQLWKREGTYGDDSVPACSNLEGKTELILWIGNFPTELKGVTSKWLFTGRVANNPRVKISSGQAYELKGDPEDSLFTSRAVTTNTAVVTFEDGGHMPWGFNSDVIWSCSFAYEGITVHVSDILRTPIELYAVSPSLPDHYRSSGVPLELLRLFVEPASRLSTIRNLDEWVAWVVKRCHASIADKSIFDKGVQPGEVPVQDRIHAFVYDIWHGGYSYVGGGYGHYFNLDSWLDDSIRKSGGNTVNCYDQAGIVQLATCLGVPSDRIKWMFKEPFGYIKGTNLVGWGNTNNPFYRNIDTSKHIDTPSNMLSSSSPFRNHAFVSYRNLSSQWVALDACAGPHTGTETVAEYLTADIDDNFDPIKQTNITTGPKGYFQDYKRTTNSAIPDDQLTITAVDPDNDGKGVTTYRTGTDRSYWWTSSTGTGGILSYNDLITKQGSAIWTSFASFVKTTPQHPKQINLARLFVAFQEKVNHHVVVPGQQKEFVFQRPWTQSLGRGNAKRTIFYQSGLDVIAPGVPRPLVSLTVKVLDTADNAVKEAGQWLSCLSKDPAALFTTPVEEDKRLGHLHLMAREPNGLNVFCFENILVWVDAMEYGVGVALAREAEGLVAQATGERDPLEMGIEVVGEVKEWETFKVVVKCDGATDVSVEEDDSRFFNTSWGRVGNTWTFEFVVLGKELWTGVGDEVPETEEGVDEIVFIAANGEGGVPRAQHVQVKIAK